MPPPTWRALHGTLTPGATPAPHMPSDLITAVLLSNSWLIFSHIGCKLCNSTMFKHSCDCCCQQQGVTTAEGGGSWQQQQLPLPRNLCGFSSSESLLVICEYLAAPPPQPEQRSWLIGMQGCSWQPAAGKWRGNGPPQGTCGAALYNAVSSLERSSFRCKKRLEYPSTTLPSGSWGACPPVGLSTVVRIALSRTKIVQGACI